MISNLLRATRRHLARRPLSRRRRPKRSAVAVEQVEERMLLTTVFLDFGEGFGPNGIVTTAEGLRSIDGFNTGPDLVDDNDGEGGIPGTTQMTFTPLDYDFDGSGTVDADDTAALRDAVVPIVERALAPFDIDVQVASAEDFDDVQASLDLNNNDQDGEFDAYNFVTELAIAGYSTSGILGIAASIDLDNQTGNQTDEATITFAENVLDSTSGQQGTAEFNENLAFLMASTAVHEALHTFTLEHTGSSDADQHLMTEGDLQRVDASTGEAHNIVTNFELELYHETGVTNAYEVLRDDADIGLRDDDRDGVPDFAYVTGTGAHDRITLTSTTPGVIDVHVEAFSDPAMLAADLIEDFEYTITDGVDTEGGIRIDASLGSDEVVIDSAVDLDTTIFGGDGDDTITGGDGDDEIHGEDGDDVIEGGDGDDSLFGDDGDDTLKGQAGEDDVTGGLGNDSLTGGGANDVLNGDEGDDILKGDEGNDTLNGDDGNDSLYGLAGNDTLAGNQGDDHMEGGTGADSMLGGGGADDIYGDGGNDTVQAGSGKDDVFGGDGDDKLEGSNDGDLINGEDGNDTIMGQSGSDTLNGGNGNDSITGGGSDDTMDGEAGADILKGDTGNDDLVGGDGNDTLQGGGGHDDIAGNGGADSLVGGGGRDTLLGGSGNDTISGDGGNDSVQAGSGADEIFGGDGNDTLNGSNDNDLIYGGDGNDMVYGGSGNDVLFGDAGVDKLFGEDGDDELNAGDVNNVDNDTGEELHGGLGSDSAVGKKDTTDSLFDIADNRTP